MEHITTRDDAPRVRSVVSTGLIVVSVIFPVISGLALIFRSRSQRKERSSVTAEDVWFWVAWVSCLSMSIIAWVFARSGIDYYNVDPAIGMKDSLRLVFLGSVLVQLPLTSVKIAILLFYKRIFATRTFAIWVWVAITIVSLWGALFFFLVLFQITPLNFEIINKVTLRYDSTALGLAQVATSIALDVLVLCMPIPVLFRLRMDPKRKWAVFFIFWLGIFCVVAAIVRLVLLSDSLSAIDANFDLIYLQSTIFIFKVIEPNASILAACLPTYGPLLKSWRAPASIIRSVRSLVSIASSGRSRERSGVRLEDEEHGKGTAQTELRTFGAGSNWKRGKRTLSQDTESLEV
ncbi:hypothetical protein F5B17DRAFT_104779 [Nemania serpens]|nr:hypothetical protein F5B17DRAFT_104779 [Nemania serpens]